MMHVFCCVYFCGDVLLRGVFVVCDWLWSCGVVFCACVCVAEMCCCEMCVLFVWICVVVRFVCMCLFCLLFGDELF